MEEERSGGTGPEDPVAFVLLAILAVFLLSGLVLLLRFGPIHPWPGSEG